MRWRTIPPRVTGASVATHRAIGEPPGLDEAYAHCERLARSHYENFTVGSLLLPRGVRPYLYAVYAFCRHTDDLGDEVPGDRLAHLGEWEEALSQAYGGRPSHPILVALQNTIRRFDIPETPFRKLIQANRMDQGQVRFPTYHDLLHYCDHSANPVGRMVLHVLGDRSEESHRLSDATCTALQLANFWQDVKRDYDAGRVYLPLEDMERFGYSEADLAAGVVNDNLRELMAFEVDRAQGLFEQGYALIERLEGRFKLDIALFTKGGMSILDSIRRQDYDVLTDRPIVTPGRKLWLMASTALRLALRRAA